MGGPGVYLQAAQQLAAGCGGLVEVMDPPPAEVVSKAHLCQDGCSGHVVFLVYENVSWAAGGCRGFGPGQGVSEFLIWCVGGCCGKGGWERQRRGAAKCGFGVSSWFEWCG